MGGKKGRNNLKFSLSSSYDETDYYFDEEMDIQIVHPTVTPKSENQKTYNRALYSISKPMVFAVGPAGTGKTMLACYAAIAGYNDKTFKKIFANQLDREDLIILMRLVNTQKYSANHFLCHPSP